MRSALHGLLAEIDDDLVPIDRVVGVLGLDGLGVLLRADWLRLVSFERGIGHVLWAEVPDEAIARIAHGTDTDVLVKMTPTGANALRALDEPGPGPASALDRFYGATAEPTLEAEVEALTRLALIPAGLVPPPDPARRGSG
jgi:hypothetical protein